MNRSLLSVLFSAALAAQSSQAPVQELKPPPPPPPTAPAQTQQTPVAPHNEHTPIKPLPAADQVVQAPVPAPGAAPLSFGSGSFKFYWDTTIPLNLEVDGLKVGEVYFNVRRSRYSWLKDAEFGVRAHVTVTNTSKRRRVPGFAVAVLDADGKLLGVASGGTKVGTVGPGETEDFDLNFTQVKERIAKGATFLLSVELRD
ncbi:MAG TPA: FxLYD domain-containing protein [Holophagaceae bacterium]|nr:FxLYD domain-containing protein [Holophagaceae bacterium]